MSNLIDHTIRAKIREVLAAQAGLTVSVDTLDDDSDLFRAGMASYASVNVMLGLENEFDIEFPDEMLTRETFRCVGSIGAAIESLRSDSPA